MDSVDRWLVLSVEVPPRESGFLVVEALRRHGARSVEADGGRLVARFPSPSDPEALRSDVAAALRSVTGGRDPETTWRWSSGDEWAARWADEVGVRRVSDRIVVAPAGEEPDLREGDLLIRLRPGVGFGTAGHATTRGCLHQLERLVEEGDRIADVGAGSGILSIAAARMGAAEVLALERDRLSVAAARENVEENGVADRVEVRHREVGPGDLALEGRFHGVVANVGSEILEPSLLPGFRAALSPRGWLLLSGFSRGDRADVLRAAGGAGLALRDERVDDGWWTGRFE